MSIKRRTGSPAGILLTLVASAVVATPVRAVTINASDRGWYDDTGFHSPGNLNYIVGDQPESSGLTFRDFFVFDVTAVAGSISSAKLRLFNPASGPGFGSDTGTETYKVFDVSTPLASLLAGTGGLGAYGDLGSGTLFGSYLASAADNGAFVEVVLNAAAIAALNAATGLFAFGGAIDPLNGVDDAEYLFGFTASNLAHTQLVVETVPEPATVLLLGAGLACLTVIRRRAGRV